MQCQSSSQLSSSHSSMSAEFWYTADLLSHSPHLQSPVQGNGGKLLAQLHLDVGEHADFLQEHFLSARTAWGAGGDKHIIATNPPVDDSSQPLSFDGSILGWGCLNPFAIWAITCARRICGIRVSLVGGKPSPSLRQSLNSSHLSSLTVLQAVFLAYVVQVNFSRAL